MLPPAFLQSNVSEYPCRRGKVRDVYDLGDSLVIIATDRISAFDWILPTGIPGKGKILTQMTLFWFDFLGVANHLLSTHLSDMPEPFQRSAQELKGRTMLVRKCQVVPIECVARGYLVGSGWKEYQQTGSVCDIELPTGLRQAEQLPEPIFTPATKAESGHDENISFASMVEVTGIDLANDLKTRTLDIYSRARAYAKDRGIIIADTKLEWGLLPDGQVILIDEVLTPDSSRFWPQDEYQVGTSPVSFDKQFVRDWLESTDWDKNSPPPDMPSAVVEKTLAKYQEALDQLTITQTK